MEEREQWERRNVYSETWMSTSAVTDVSGGLASPARPQEESLGKAHLGLHENYLAGQKRRDKILSPYLNSYIPLVQWGASVLLTGLTHTCGPLGAKTGLITACQVAVKKHSIFGAKLN